jgi:alkaline phosphatase D
MLGATQLSWFEQTLRDAQAQGITWKFVAISSPIDQIGPIGGSFTVTNAGGSYANVESDGGKSWMGGYRSERNELLKFIADNHIDHVVFLTTDDHQVRINELGYFAVPGDQSSYTRVPGCFQILVGPLGAGGPDGITDHSFTNIQSIADSFASQQEALGIDPIGLDPAFPGLSNVYRDGDPDADVLRRPVDFYSAEKGMGKISGPNESLMPQAADAPTAYFPWPARPARPDSRTQSALGERPAAVAPGGEARIEHGDGIVTAQPTGGSPCCGPLGC